MGVLTKELDAIMAKKDFKVAQIATDLHNALTANSPRITPVGDPSKWKVNIGKTTIWRPKGYTGGSLRDAWELNKIKGGWQVFNPLEYADIAMAPYVSEGGIHQGSLQNPAGLKPTLDKFDRIMQTEMNKIK